MKSAKVRLFVDQPLDRGQSVALSRDQAHYLTGVMRKSADDNVTVFNGRDGEWRAEVAGVGRRGGALTCLEQIGPQAYPPDLWLLFAPIKKARTEFIVEKAVELGAARIVPVTTDFINAERNRLVGLEQSNPVALGPRNLRAETAAVAALTIWQNTPGDWT